MMGMNDSPPAFPYENGNGTTTEMETHHPHDDGNNMINNRQMTVSNKSGPFTILTLVLQGLSGK